MPTMSNARPVKAATPWAAVTVVVPLSALPPRADANAIFTMSSKVVDRLP